MNKTKTLIFLVGMFLLFGVGFTIAGALLFAHNPTVALSKDVRDKYIEKDLLNPNVSECIDVGNWNCEFKMFKVLDESTNEVYNLGTHLIPLRNCTLINISTGGCLNFVNYTEEELAVLINEKIEVWLEEYGLIMIERDNKVDGDVKLGSGEISITEKK